MSNPLDPTAVYISGPARLLVGSATIHSRDDIKFEPTPVLDPVMSVEGLEDYSIRDTLAKLSFTPMALWENMDVLFPAFYKTAVIGTRLNAANIAWKIWASNGDLWNLYNAHVTKPPQLLLGADSDPFGAVEVTAITVNNKKPGESTATWDGPTASQADPTAALAMTNFLKCRWTGSFSTTTNGTDYVAVTGFSTFEPYDHFTVDFNPQMTPDTAQGLTRNWRLDAPGFSVKCVPVGPTSANIAAARGASTNPVQGALASSFGKFGRLVLTSDVGSHSITFDHVYMTQSSDIFGKPLRNGEISFTNVLKRSSGNIAQLVTFA